MRRTGRGGCLSAGNAIPGAVVLAALVVASAMGGCGSGDGGGDPHLVELADPGVYDEKYKTWALDYLPMLPDRMKHKVIGRTSHQFRMIKSLFKRDDVNHLVIATDAGREGELVARWIMRLGG